MGPYYTAAIISSISLGSIQRFTYRRSIQIYPKLYPSYKGEERSYSVTKVKKLTGF